MGTEFGWESILQNTHTYTYIYIYIYDIGVFTKGALAQWRGRAASHQYQGNIQ